MAISATATKKETAIPLGRHGQARQQGPRQVACGERAGAARRPAPPGRRRRRASRSRARPSESGGKVKPEDIAVFSRQLATMLAAGIPHGAGLRDHRQRPRKAGDAEAGARHQGRTSRAAPRCTSRSPSIRCISTICSSTWSRRASRPARSRRCSTRSRPTRKRPRPSRRRSRRRCSIRPRCCASR